MISSMMTVLASGVIPISGQPDENTRRLMSVSGGMATDNAEDFKQGAKIAKASVSRRGWVGTLLKIPLC